MNPLYAPRIVGSDLLQPKLPMMLSYDVSRSVAL